MRGSHSLSAQNAKDEVKRSEGPPATSRGPEGPYISSILNIIKSIIISIVMIIQVTTLTLEEEGSRLCLHQIAEKDQVVTPSLFILIEDLDD